MTELVFDELELCPAVRTLGMTRLLDREIDAGMRIPQDHFGRGATQRQIARFDLIAAFSICWEVFSLSISMGIGVGSSHGGIVP